MDGASSLKLGIIHTNFTSSVNSFFLISYEHFSVIADFMTSLHASFGQKVAKFLDPV